jgi:L-aspartate oxidase
VEGYDFVVCGSGIAGLFAALEAEQRGKTVLLLTKGSLEESNTRWAQGGIAAAWSDDDSADLHFQDTVSAGAGLVDEQAARILVEDGPDRVRDLIALGVRFDGGSASPALGLEAAHSVPRVLHAGGDATGLEIEQALARLARSRRVTIREGALVTSLAVERGVVQGVSYIDLRSSQIAQAGAAAVVLATGGAGQLYSHTTNPAVATGDGVALAIEAGAELQDLEFYQFHPTALQLAGAPAFLISEAVRGEGGVLSSARNGERFMPAVHERAELAPRDVVARAIVARMAEDGMDHVMLDLSHLDPGAVRSRFPHIADVCAQYGLDITRQPIPVSPAAHYMMGGVRTNLDGQTSLEGLYACGEVACTGVHGANRLASNSLLETVVFAQRAVDRQIQFASLKSSERKWLAPAWAVAAAEFHLPAEPGSNSEKAAPDLQQVQQLMWEQVGIVRSGPGLSDAASQLETWLAAARQDAFPGGSRAGHELRNLLTTGYLEALAALRREESRGAHFRSDFPQSDPAWARHQVWRRAAPA